MTFWNVVWAVVIGNVITTAAVLILSFLLSWEAKPRYKGPRPGGDATAKQVQMAWDEAMGDEEPEEPEPEEVGWLNPHVSDEEDPEPYLGWAGTTDYEEPHDCLLAGCLDNENEEPCPNA